MTEQRWRVVVAKSARRQFSEQLPEAVAAACYEFLAGPLASNPRRVGAPLRKPFEGQWRARRGSYRIRYRIDTATETIFVLDVEHRRDAYRR